MSKPDVKYEDLLHSQDEITRLKDNGIDTFYKKNKLKIGLGVACLVVAIIPNGLGVICYPMGFTLLVSGGVDVSGLNKKFKQRLKFKLWSMRR